MPRIFVLRFFVLRLFVIGFAVVGGTLVFALFADFVSADNWPTWRGATGQGICFETDLPTEWGPTKNVKWKTPLPDRGNSTPIVWGTRVFLTQATEGGKERWTYCFDRTDGKVLWRRNVSYSDPEPTHKTNPYCAASPVTDGERVIVSHGSAGVHCYDFDGTKKWERDLGRFHHVWGNASSPVIHGELCILNCGPGERTFLIAVEKTTGKTVWKTDVPGGREGGDKKTWTGSWSTPLLARESGRDVLYVSYPGWLSALRPSDGQEIWKSGGLGRLVYTSPLSNGETVVSMSGFMGPPMAVRAGGTGDVTSSHRSWRFERAPQRIGSGVIHDGHIFIVNDPGVAECLNLKTGDRVWRERLGAKSWSSVVLAGDRLYTADKDGNFFVVRAATEFEIIARNELGESTCSSVVVSNGELFLRTYKHLWCIANASGS